MKLNTPTKETYPKILTRGHMEIAVREIAGLRLDEKLLEADMEGDLKAIRESYEPRFKALNVALESRTRAARDWAERHPAEFGRRRSINFAHGAAGFRLGPPRLKTIAKTSWDSVLEALHKLRWGAPYIRLKEEINKEQILADVGAGKLPTANLLLAGAEIVQDESFFIETREARSR